MNTIFITVSGVCCLFLLCVYACESCSNSILFVYVYVRMPSSPRSIAGVPSSQALLGYLCHGTLQGCKQAGCRRRQERRSSPDKPLAYNLVLVSL